MERSMTEAVMDTMADRILNPEFHAAMDAGFEPSIHEDSEREAVEHGVIEHEPFEPDAVEQADAEALDDPEFAAMVSMMSMMSAAEAEAEADVALPRALAAPEGESAGFKVSPFALLVNPRPVIAAAKHLESLGLPRRVVFLFGKKGVTSNPEISRLDQDMDLEDADEDLEEEAPEAQVAV